MYRSLLAALMTKTRMQALRILTKPYIRRQAHTKRKCSLLREDLDTRNRRRDDEGTGGRGRGLLVGGQKTGVVRRYDQTNDEDGSDVENEEAPERAADLQRAISPISTLLSGAVLTVAGTVLRGFLASPKVTPTSSLPMSVMPGFSV